MNEFRKKKYPNKSSIILLLLQAHKAGETFRVFILMPLLPAFEGDVSGDSGTGATIKESKHNTWVQYLSACSAGIAVSIFSLSINKTNRNADNHTLPVSIHPNPSQSISIHLNASQSISITIRNADNHALPVPIHLKRMPFPCTASWRGGGSDFSKKASMSS